jgi:large subunit ribosomal protein L9
MGYYLNKRGLDMRVILQQEVTNLGKVGDQVSVKPGFGRNYLLPNEIAKLATPKNIADFEVRRVELEKAAAQVLAQAKKRAEQLAELVVVITAQAGDEGKLFGSIGPRDIAIAISETGATKGLKVEKKEVIMSEGPIRQVGEFVVTLKLHSEISMPLTVKVVSESGA